MEITPVLRQQFQPKIDELFLARAPAGKCSSFKFERNIVFQPETAQGKMVETTFFAGLDNFTFTKNMCLASPTNIYVMLQMDP